MEVNDQVDQLSISEDELDQDRSEDVKKHEGTESAKNSDVNSIDEEKSLDHAATDPGDRPEQSQDHPTAPGDPAESLPDDQKLERNSVAGSDVGNPNHGLIVENGGGSDFDVVMVHGLGQERRSAWIDELSISITWMEQAYPTARIFLYGYNTDPSDSDIFTTRGIVNEATRLLHQLDTYRRDNLPNRSLVFMSHGLGGLLVKAVLILASKLPDKYAYILEETTCLVFMGYSIGHSPSSVPILQEQILTLLLHDFDEYKYKPGRLMPCAHSLTKAVLELHDNFVHTKMFIRAQILNIAPREFDNYIADQLLQRSDFVKRTACEPGISWKYDVKFPEMTHLQLAKYHENWLYGDLDETKRKVLTDFISQAPPFYPSRARTGPDSFDVLDELSTLRGGRVLHVRCTSDTRAVADFAWEYLNSRPAEPSVLRFDFNPLDVRFASLDAMVRAFLSQLAAQGLVSRKWGVERMLFHTTSTRAWMAQSLMTSLTRFISIHQAELVFVISGLEDCKGPVKDFVDMVLRNQCLSDEWFRIVILTKAGNDSRITDMLSDLPRDSVRELTVDPELFFAPEDEQTRFDYSILVQKQFPLMRDEESSALAQALATLTREYNYSLSHLILSWIESTKIPVIEVKKTLELIQSGEPTAERVIRALLLSVPQEKHRWAKQLLRWVVFSMRPLRVEELCIVSQLVSPQNGGTTAADILTWLGGVLRFEYDEVHFAHTQIRSWLVREAKDITAPTGDETWCHFDPDNTSQDHLDILMLCLKYLQSPEGHSTGGVWPAKHVFPYAWQYWTTHYHLAKASTEFPSAQETALTILRDDATFRRWINVYRDLADPFTLFDSEELSHISIAAHFGLDDLLRVLTSEAKSDWAVLPPLIEATRGGHLSTVRVLKQALRGPLSIADDKLGELVEVAASCGHLEVLQEILTLIPKTKETSDSQDTKPAWLSSVLFQACWMDNKCLAEAVLDLGADMNATMPSSHPTDGDTSTNILSIAIMADAIEVVNLLLDRGYDLKNDATILPTFVDWSTPEMAELILKNGWDFKSHPSDERTLLQRACDTGKPVIVDGLLRYEPDLAAHINPEVAGEPLLLAVKAQQIKCVRRLLDHGVDINVADDRGNALYHAVDEGNVGLCRMLLEHEKDKIDVNYCAPDSKPPLVHAIIHLTDSDDKLVEIVKLLLDKGADVRKTEDGDGGRAWKRTPLLAASAQDVNGIEEVIRMLLDHGSEIDAKDSDGWTSLYTAACHNTADVGELLIEAKADLCATTKDDNQSPIHGAYAKPDFINLLLRSGVDAMRDSKAEATPLQMCAREGLTNSMEVILGFSKEIKDAALTDALMDAFDNYHEESVRLLLDHGASVNRVQQDTNMPLISRALQGNLLSMLRLLLEYRPLLDVVDNDENSALHCINGFTSVQSVKALVNATAKLDVLNKRKQSPLAVAVDSQNWDVVTYLLSKPAVLPTINIPGYLGTPLHRACRLGTLDIVEYLIKRGADPDISCEGLGTPLSQACIRIGHNYAAEKEDMIRYLLEKSDGALAPTSSGSAAPMHYAALTCSEAIITLFVEKGAAKSTEDDMGRRPLHLACYNSLEAVKALNVADEEFAARDKVGRVPLHYAVMAAYTAPETEGSPSFLEYVLERTKAAGLGIDVTDKDGWTPLLWSVRDSTIFEWGDDNRIQSPLTTFQKLVENKANLSAVGQVRRDITTSTSLEERWSLADIAAYHDNTVIVEHLAETVENLPNTSKKATRNVGIPFTGRYCDCCYLRIYGEHFECGYCVNLFHLCFKCYGSKDVLHPAHDFVRKGGDVDNSDEQADAQSVSIAIEDSEHASHVSEEHVDDEVVSELSSAEDD